MTNHVTALGKDDRALRMGKEESTRLLIEEFYKDSVGRYGAESEQARTLSQILTASDLMRLSALYSRMKTPYLVSRGMKKFSQAEACATI
jgi:hypothetical protein